MDYFRNKQNEFSVLKFSLIIVLVGFITITAIREFKNYKILRDLTSSIYVISKENGTILKLDNVLYTSKERKAEYIAHVRDFLKHFYQFHRFNFTENMDYASNLMHSDAFKIELEKYQTDQIYTAIQEREIISSIKIRDINIEYSTGQGEFSLIQTLSLISENSIIKKKRIISGILKIEDISGRSIMNPHACLITNYKVSQKEEI